MDAVGKQLTRAQSTYDDAMKQLSTGRGNIITSVEKLRTLGAKASKSMSLANMPEDEDDVPVLESKAGLA